MKTVKMKRLVVPLSFFRNGMLITLLIISSLGALPIKLVWAEALDLNALMLAAFKEWDAFYTRCLSNNATLSDISDYSRKASSRASNRTLSGLGFYLLALASIYDATKDNYYLQKLRYIVDTAIDSSFYYQNVTGIGTIFYSPEFWFNNQENNGAPLNTMAIGTVAIRIYKWTGETKYKILADRIASESRKLVVVNNSTDQAWSWAYYYNRDETNAKIGVNHQGMIAYFYAWYGKEINPTYLTYVPLVINWIWRAQLASEGLAYNIGGTSENTEYSAFSTWMAINAHRLNSSVLSSTLKTKINNTLVWLRDKRQFITNCLQLAIGSAAYMVAVKDSYFSGTITVNSAKSFAYIMLQAFQYSGSEGIVTTPSDFGLGWRFQAYFLGAFFSEYPFATATFLLDTELSGLKIWEKWPGRFDIAGWTLTPVAVAIYDGGNNYGVGWGFVSRYIRPVYKDWVVVTSRNVTAYSHYWKTTTEYTGINVVQYTYPTSIYVSDVSGANQIFDIYLDYKANWQAYFPNGTSVTLLTLANDTYRMNEKFLIYLNDTEIRNRRTFYINSPLLDWTFTRTASYLRFQTIAAQSSWRSIIGFLPAYVIAGTPAKIYTYFDNLADIYNTTQPVSLDTMISTYQTELGKLITEPSWLSTYHKAVNGTVNLIAHNFPESVSLAAWDFASNRLTFTISAPSGTSSTTKVYCGDEGEPTAVYAANGTLTWSYNASTTILTLNVTHASPTRILVYWKFPGDIDGDGDVDADDFYIFAGAYGTSPPSNPECDLDGDGDVDSDDFAIFAGNYGKTEP